MLGMCHNRYVPVRWLRTLMNPTSGGFHAKSASDFRLAGWPMVRNDSSSKNSAAKQRAARGYKRCASAVRSARVHSSFVSGFIVLRNFSV